MSTYIYICMYICIHHNALRVERDRTPSTLSDLCIRITHHCFKVYTVGPLSSERQSNATSTPTPEIIAFAKRPQ